MSAPKVGEAAKEEAAAQVFTTAETKVVKSKLSATEIIAQNQGPKFTPKGEMRIGRNWTQASWNQAMKALEKKWARENYSKRNESK